MRTTLAGDSRKPWMRSSHHQRPAGTIIDANVTISMMTQSVERQLMFRAEMSSRPDLNNQTRIAAASAILADQMSQVRDRLAGRSSTGAVVRAVASGGILISQRPQFPGIVRRLRCLAPRRS